jgi:hypothetical protein
MHCGDGRKDYRRIMMISLAIIAAFVLSPIQVWAVTAVALMVSIVTAIYFAVVGAMAYLPLRFLWRITEAVHSILERRMLRAALISLLLAPSLGVNLVGFAPLPLWLSIPYYISMSRKGVDLFYFPGEKIVLWIPVASFVVCSVVAFGILLLWEAKHQRKIHEDA